MSSFHSDTQVLSPTSLLNNSSTITTISTSSGISSIIESETSSTTENDMLNVSFITENPKVLYKLMDDLSIIDNIYNLFETRTEHSNYDKQIIRNEKHINMKRKTIDTLLQSEIEYTTELFTFEKLYTSRLKHWLDTSAETDVTIKNKMASVKLDLEVLSNQIHNIAITHTNFIKDLKDRVQLWGPTQLISDLFSNLYTSLDVYQPLMTHHPEFVMVFSELFTIPSFIRLMENVVKEDKNLKLSSPNGVINYIQLPLNHLKTYSKMVKQLIANSDPMIPDYNNLKIIYRQYTNLENEWAAKIKDSQAHLSVLETFLTIESCPISVTHNRRLILFSKLIKVDLDDITSTNDVRMYFLYNDSLIYCKIQKDKKESSHSKYIYKGTLNLKGAEIRQLAPAFCAKMCEVKKSLFRIGKKGADTTSLSDAEAFGFELVATEVNLDAMSALHQNYQTATAGAGSPLLRRHVLRTKSQSQQKAWFEGIRDAIKAANAQN